LESFNKSTEHATDGLQPRHAIEQKNNFIIEASTQKASTRSQARHRLSEPFVNLIITELLGWGELAIQFAAVESALYIIMVFGSSSFAPFILLMGCGFAAGAYGDANLMKGGSERPPISDWYLFIIYFVLLMWFY
jgi:hypothetical protein